MNKRELIVGGAALATCPTMRMSMAQEAAPLAGVWSTALIGAAGELARARLTISADGAATMQTRPDNTIAGRAEFRARDNRVEIDFPPTTTFAGSTIRGRLVGADRIEAYYAQVGFETELAFLKGDLRLDAPVIPALDEAGAERLVAETGIPAISIAARRDGGPLRQWLAGERRRGSGVRVEPGDIWLLNSVTKSFTATLVGRMVEKGAVRWDDRLGDILGDRIPGMRPEYRGASFLHLLSHRAGMVWDAPWGRQKGFSSELADAPRERIRYLQQSLDLEPVAPPGSRVYAYSNVGYFAAVAMLEARTGRPFEDLMRRELFEPLGLSSGSFTSTTRSLRTATDRRARRPPLSQPEGHWEADNPSLGDRFHNIRMRVLDVDVPMAGAGGIYMSLPDLVTYLMAHKDAHPYLRPDTWRTLHTDPFGQGYALGWVLEAQEGVFSHNGGNGDFESRVYFNRNAGVVAAAIKNTGKRGVILDNVVRRAANTVGEPLRAAPPRRSYPQPAAARVASAVLRRYAGRYRVEVGNTGGRFNTVKYENGALSLDMESGGPIPLIPLSDTQFFLQGREAHIVFRIDSAGRIAGFHGSTGMGVWATRRLG